MSNQFEKWKAGLTRTRKSTFGQIANLFGLSDLTEATWDQLEALLVQADIGIETTLSLLDELKIQAKDEGWTKNEELKIGLRNALSRQISVPIPYQFNQDPPTVILIVGVNGSGKTTTIAKLAKRYQTEGKSVLLAAADTYRAAAIEQLQAWGERLDLRVIAGQPESDPGAVAYDAVSSAIARNVDVLLIDTAGRLHTKYNLMEELKKVYRVCSKPLPSAPHAVWLVLDATTGQNAIQQAKAFKEAVNVSGIILTKLDSSAKGGMVFAIERTLNLPILYVGLGEKAEDLVPFDAEAFIESILADLK